MECSRDPPLAAVQHVLLSVALDPQGDVRRSELATSGSVIAKADRISPSSNGRSHRSCCSACRTGTGFHVARVGRRTVTGSDAIGLRPGSQPGARTRHCSGRRRTWDQVEHVPQPTLMRLGLQLLHHRGLRVWISRLTQLLLVTFSAGYTRSAMNAAGAPEIPGSGAQLEVHGTSLHAGGGLTRVTRVQSR